MKKMKMNVYYLAILICLVILVIAGTSYAYIRYLPLAGPSENQSQDIPGPVSRRIPDLYAILRRLFPGSLFRSIRPSRSGPDARHPLFP